MIPRTISLLVVVSLMASASSGLGQTLLYHWDHTANGWPNPPFTVANGRMTLSKACGPFQPGDAWATWAGAGQPLGTSGPLANNTTIEARFDLVGANQDDTSAGVNFWWASFNAGYIFWKDQDEIALQKYSLQSGNHWAVLFAQTNQPIKNQNITMVFSLTRLDPDLRMDMRVLDKDNNDGLLFARTIFDTPNADPVSPLWEEDMPGWEEDMPGAPWPMISEPEYICPNLLYSNPQHAPNGGLAQVSFSDIQVWRYESPQLALQNAVMLSWPATAGLFLLETAPSLTGPWAAVVDPLIRTNASRIEASVVASQSMQLFRLRFTP